jgi:hypothetical protein
MIVDIKQSLKNQVGELLQRADGHQLKFAAETKKVEPFTAAKRRNHRYFACTQLFLLNAETEARLW